MTLAQFLATDRILRELDRIDVLAAFPSDDGWAVFCIDPVRWLRRAERGRAAIVWAAVEIRQNGGRI